MSIQTAIPAALALIVPGLDATWRDRETGFRADRHVKLRVLSRPRIGVDEIRHSDPDEIDGSMVERVYGVRRLTVQITVETQDQDIADSAHALAEDLRTGLERSDVEALLEADDLGSPRTTEPREIPYRDPSGRWRSAVVFEAWFPAHTSHTGPIVDTVGSVEVEGLDADTDATILGPVTFSE